MTRDTVQVDVFRFHQKGLAFYVGVMRADDVRQMFDVQKFRGEELDDGYQRELYDERAVEIAYFLDKCPIPMIPALLVSLREGRYTFKDGADHLGKLLLQREKGTLWMVDGQHRAGGFQTLHSKLVKEEEQLTVPASFLSDFLVPVVFLDLETSVANVRKVQTDDVAPIKGGDLEKALFFIQNETAKKLRPSLRDNLAYRLVVTGIGAEIPAIKKKGAWRAEGTRLVHEVSKLPPFKGLINIAGSRATKGMHRPVQLASFVSSLQPLLTSNPKFFGLGDKVLKPSERVDFLQRYWMAVRDLAPDAFSEEKAVRDRYVILKVIGVYALNWLANDVFNWATQTAPVPSEGDIKKHLSPLSDFDWNRRTANAPLAGLGGLAGVKKAHRILLDHMAATGADEPKKAVLAYSNSRP